MRAAAFAVWLAMLVTEYTLLARNPTLWNFSLAVAFTLLFFATNAQVWARQMAGTRSLRHIMARLHSSSYISDYVPLPNRNYLLAELRREMARSRVSGSPFTIVRMELEGYEEVRGRRGEDFSSRSLRAFADLLRRVTRNSDFLAHLEGAIFAVMLLDCSRRNAGLYLNRIPGTLAVSDGHRMLDLRISARVHEYDMETLYATDVLAGLDHETALQRELPPDFSTAA
jgi:diguanylate cyclase (GGDEF)-like protein